MFAAKSCFFDVLIHVCAKRGIKKGPRNVFVAFSMGILTWLAGEWTDELLYSVGGRTRSEWRDEHRDGRKESVTSGINHSTHL